MEILNARITMVCVGLDDNDRLSASMTFEHVKGCCDWNFVLENPVDVQRLKALMDYAGVCEVKDLKGQIVRQVYSECYLRAFGHPFEDKFVPITPGGKFVVLSELEVDAWLAP